MSTKFLELEKKERKAVLAYQLPLSVTSIQEWQSKRIVLLHNNYNLEKLTKLLVGEILEVIIEINKIDGSANYLLLIKLKELLKELVDVANYASGLEMVLNKEQRFHSDFNQILSRANGQAKKSNIFDYMQEVAGNINEKNLRKDLETFWILLSSCFLNFEIRVSPLNILLEEVIPKNNNNHNEEILSHNPLFKQAFGRDVIKMSGDEKQAYYDHCSKCGRIIRDFYAKHIDPSSAEKGVPKGLMKQYAFYFYCFTSFSGIGIDSEKAQQLLREKLAEDYADYLDRFILAK